MVLEAVPLLFALAFTWFAIAQAQVFGTRLPKQFIDRYQWKADSLIDKHRLAEDLEYLKQGAESGWQVPSPSAEEFNSWSVQKQTTFTWMKEQFNSLLSLGKTQDEEYWYHEKQQNEFQQHAAEHWQELHDQRRRMEAEMEWMKEETERLRQQGKEQQNRQAELERQRAELRQEAARLEEQRRRQRVERDRQEAERRRLWSFSARGDPRLCPHDSGGQILEDFCVDYTGPATVMCFDELGSLQSIDFVGVCDEHGGNCQSQDAYWVGEQWRYDLREKAFKYRNVKGQKVADVSCANDWQSQKAPSSTPPTTWLEAFNGGRSFVLHALQPRIMDGPPFSFIWETLVSDPWNASFSRAHVGQWVNAMLMLQGHASQHGAVGNAFSLMAKYVVYYGIAAHTRARGLVSSEL